MMALSKLTVWQTVTLLLDGILNFNYFPPVSPTHTMKRNQVYIGNRSFMRIFVAVCLILFSFVFLKLMAAALSRYLALHGIFLVE